MTYSKILAIYTIAISTAIAGALFSKNSDTTERWIVQALSLEAAQIAVLRTGGLITHHLDVIKAVGSDLTKAQVVQLDLIDGIRLFSDHTLKDAGQ